MNEKVYIEIRSAEGGDDAKLLVQEMVDIYQKTANVEGFKIESISVKTGFAAVCL